MKTIRTFATRPVNVLPSLAAALLAVLAFAAPASADGPSRPATDKEEKFHALVMGVFEKAIPPGPKGWEEERAAIEPLERVTTDAEKYPFRVIYRVKWTDRQRLDEAEPAQMEALTKIATDPDLEGQELMRRNEKLAEELGEAAGKGDQARIARIGKELEEIQRKYDVINAARDKREKEALRKHSPRDTSLVVTLTANLFSESFYRETLAEPPIGGGLVFRTKEAFDENSGWREGTTYVLLGKGWKLMKDGGSWVETKGRPGAPSLAAQAIVVRVDADAARAKAFLAKVDWDALKKLLLN